MPETTQNEPESEARPEFYSFKRGDEVTQINADQATPEGLQQYFGLNSRRLLLRGTQDRNGARISYMCKSSTDRSKFEPPLKADVVYNIEEMSSEAVVAKETELIQIIRQGTIFDGPVLDFAQNWHTIIPVIKLCLYVKYLATFAGSMEDDIWLTPNEKNKTTFSRTDSLKTMLSELHINIYNTTYGLTNGLFKVATSFQMVQNYFQIIMDAVHSGKNSNDVSAIQTTNLERIQEILVEGHNIIKATADNVDRFFEHLSVLRGALNDESSGDQSFRQPELLENERDNLRNQVHVKEKEIEDDREHIALEQQEADMLSKLLDDMKLGNENRGIFSLKKKNDAELATLKNNIASKTGAIETLRRTMAKHEANLNDITANIRELDQQIKRAKNLRNIDIFLQDCNNALSGIQEEWSVLQNFFGKAAILMEHMQRFCIQHLKNMLVEGCIDIREPRNQQQYLRTAAKLGMECLVFEKFARHCSDFLSNKSDAVKKLAGSIGLHKYDKEMAEERKQQLDAEVLALEQSIKANAAKMCEAFNQNIQKSIGTMEELMLTKALAVIDQKP